MALKCISMVIRVIGHVTEGRRMFSVTRPICDSGDNKAMAITIGSAAPTFNKTPTLPPPPKATVAAIRGDSFVQGGFSGSSSRMAPPLPQARPTDGPSMSDGKPPKADERVSVQIDLAKAYQAKNPELDAWRQAAMKAGYGAEMGFVEASSNPGDFNWKEANKSGAVGKSDYPDTAAAYRTQFKSEPGKMNYNLSITELKDARTAMKLGFESLTDFQRYNTTDDKSSRLSPALKDMLLSSSGTRTLGSSSPPLSDLKDRGLASLGASLSSYTSAVRRQQSGEQNPQLTSYIEKQRASLESRGTGSPINKDIRDYIKSVDAGARSTESEGAGSCVGVNVTVGPFTAGVAECSNGKNYGSVGVTTGLGLGGDVQFTAVKPIPGKTIDDVVSGDSEGVTVSSAKLGGTASTTTGSGGTTVSAGPSVGLGLPVGINKSTTFQIGSRAPQERVVGGVAYPTVRPQ
jgi:hypothetical protein